MSRQSKKVFSGKGVRACPGSVASGNSPAIAGGHRLVAGICIFLAVIVWLVFGQTAYFGFVSYDDGGNVFENPVVEKGLGWSGVVWAFTHVQVCNWIPLTTLSHMMDCQIFGLNAGGHHLTNVLLHTAVVILLFLVLRLMTGAVLRSAFVAAVFAIHPLRAESVAWVSERKDVLSGLFFMLTLLAYVHHVRRPQSRVRYWLVVFLFSLGLMSKPMLVTLPFVLLLLDYWPLNRFSPAVAVAGPVGFPKFALVSLRLVLEKIPLLALAVVSCVVTVLAQSDAIRPLQEASFSLRIGNAVVSYVTYVWQMFYPARLAVFYPYPMNGLPVLEIVGAFVLLAVVTLVFFLGRRERPYLLVGWLWYLGMLMPVIGLVQVGSQAYADRYTYLPQIGLYLMVTWMVVELSTRWKRRELILGVISIAVVVMLVYFACIQTACWEGDESLWSHALEVATDNSIARNNLGGAIFDKGRTDEAMKNFQKALEIDSNNAEAWNNLGSVLFHRGQVEEAIENFRKALEIEPDFAKARNNYGNALLKEGRVDEAVKQFEQALAMEPGIPYAHYNLGNYYLERGRLEEAAVEFQKEVDIQPGFVEARNSLGAALRQKGRVDEAIVQFKKALAIDPGFVPAQNNLAMIAWVLAASPDSSVRNGGKAVEVALETERLCGGGNPVVMRALAAGEAEAGRYDEALGTAQSAMRLAVAAGNTKLAGLLQGDMKLYAASAPVRDARP